MNHNRQSSLSRLDLNSKPQKLLTRRTPLSLYKYVWGVCGVLLLFLISFPLAYQKVARSEKFDEQPFRSLSWSDSQKEQHSYPDK